MRQVIQKGRHNKYSLKENRNLFLFPREWNKIMSKAKRRQIPTFMLLINTGARINEARHIKFGDIDYERNYVTIRITKVKAKKGEKKPIPRLVPISNQFKKYLKKLMKERNLTMEDYIPTISTSAMAYALKQHTKRIGRKDWYDFSAHNLRKTFECWLIALGIDGFKVAKHLGHTPSVALSSYISPDIFSNDDKQEIRKILGDLYSYSEKRY